MEIGKSKLLVIIQKWTRNFFGEFLNQGKSQESEARRTSQAL